jgi:cation transport protein ChaC
MLICLVSYYTSTFLRKLVALTCHTRSFDTIANNPMKHPTAPMRVWGAAYHIPPSRVQEVKEYLDIREINGYSIDYVPFHTSGPRSTTMTSNTDTRHPQSPRHDAPAPINCLVYIGLPSNPQFVGPESSSALAKHIVRSRGPSGENKEYVYMLEEALDGLKKEMGMQNAEEIDDYVVDLARRVREEEAILAERTGK